MSDKKISDLVELTSLAADDVLPVVDASANATKRVTYDTLATEVRTESEPLSATTVTASGDITSNGETVYHRGNVVGTVSQSGGTPTGAVVERDSNANGEYVKFADGTLINWNNDFTVTFKSSSDLYDNWTFPEPFVDDTYTSLALAFSFTISVSDLANSFVNTRLFDKDGVEFRMKSDFRYSSGDSQIFRVFAIGRWF